MNKKKDKFSEIKNSSRRLNLGCGDKYMSGWLNVDISNKDIYQTGIKIDFSHDLDTFPYPFPENYFEEVLIDNVLEHLEDPKRVMEELERICKRGAMIKIIVPHFSFFKAYMDPTHKHYFSLESIGLLLLNRKIEIIKKEFEISDNIIVRNIGKVFTLSPSFYERFLYGYFPIQGIRWTLKVNK